MTPTDRPDDASARARLLGHRPFQLFLGARMSSRFAVQIATVALGWQVYALTGSAFALGMIGLAQFLPTLLLVFVAGHAADRYDRRRVLQICQTVQGLVAVALARGTLEGVLTVHWLSTRAVARASACRPPSRRRRARRCCRGRAHRAAPARDGGAHGGLPARGDLRSGGRRLRLRGVAGAALRDDGGLLADRAAC